MDVESKGKEGRRQGGREVGKEGGSGVKCLLPFVFSRPSFREPSRAESLLPEARAPPSGHSIEHGFGEGKLRWSHNFHGRRAVGGGGLFGAGWVWSAFGLPPLEAAGVPLGGAGPSGTGDWGRSVSNHPSLSESPLFHLERWKKKIVCSERHRPRILSP